MKIFERHERSTEGKHRRLCINECMQFISSYKQGCKGFNRSTEGEHRRLCRNDCMQFISYYKQGWSYALTEISEGFRKVNLACELITDNERI